MVLSSLKVNGILSFYRVSPATHDEKKERQPGALFNFTRLR
jgi:hypothetical protein